MNVLTGVLQTLGVEFVKLLTNILAFLIFFGLLYKFAWKNVGGVLEARRTRIRAELEAIEEGRKEIERLKAEYLSKIREIETEAQLRFGRIEAAARDKAADILAEASGKAHKFIESARKDIENEVEQARHALIGEISTLACAAAEKVLERQINEADGRRLVESFLTDLERSKTAV